MNYLLMGLGVAVLVCLMVSTGSAHPPADLNLTYNQTTGNLSATFNHQVADQTTHYIDNVRVLMDGKEMYKEDYKSQPSKDEFTYDYPVNATVNSNISVVGWCSVGGSIEKSLIV